jgi:hypothetical protein
MPIENEGAQASQAALAYLEKTQDIREQRTGVTKASAGLDADAMQSTEKVAAAAQISAAQQHVELIARSFAEMGIAPLFRGILRLLVANPPRKKMVKMRGKYIEMDPRSWDANLAVVVNVPIGAGLLSERIARLTEHTTKMEGIFNTMGLANPVVTPRQYRDMLVRLGRMEGFADADTWYQEVPADWKPPQQQGNDPNMVIAQAEKQKADAIVQKHQADTQLAQQKHQVDVQGKQSEQQMKMAELQQKAQIESESMQMEAQLKREQMELEDRRQRDQMELDDRRQREQMRLEHERKQAEAKAQKVESSSSGAEGSSEGGKKTADRTFHVKKGADGGFEIKVT